MDLKLLIFLAVVFLVKAQEDGDYVRFCYYTNWSQYRPGEAEFVPEDIDPFLCTHVFFAFASIDEENQLTTSGPNDVELYGRLNSLKEQNPDLKTVLAVGGWSFGMSQVSEMLATSESRATFISSSIDFLRTYEFNGIDLDFEYPGNEDQGSIPEDKYKFSELVMEMKAAFEGEAADSGNSQLMLTAAVGARKENVDDGYEISVIAQYLDYILLMSYDLHGIWEDFTGLNAPLYSREDEEGDQRYFNVDYAVNYWLDNGASSEQLVLGLGFFGKSFMLSSEDTGLGAPVSGPGPAGPLGEAGVYLYTEYCSGGEGNKVFDEEQKAPYGWRDDGVWIGYEDYRSIACKVNYMNDKDLAGFFVWSIDLDDFNGSFCGEGVYPLMNYILDLIDTDGDPMGACNGM